MSQWSQHSHLLTCIFCDKFISSSTVVIDKSFNCSNSLSDNTTMLWAFLLILVLNQSYHQTHIADELTYIIVLATHCFYLISVVFSLLHDKHFETNKKISNRIDESNTPFYNTIYRLVWFVGWIHFLFSSLFSRENCIWSPCFFSLRRDY